MLAEQGMTQGRPKNSRLESPEGKLIKWRIFAVSYIAYAALHAVRTSWAYVKPDVSRDMNWSMVFIGSLDMVFLLAYGFGLFLSGMVGDHMNRRKFLALGMYMAFIGYFAVAVVGHAGDINAWFMRVAFAFNGLGESTGWPGHVSLIGAWFGGENLKTTMGLWSSCQNVGNVIGQQFGHFFDPKVNLAAGVTAKDIAFQWTNVILVASFFVIICAVLINCFVYHDPKEAGLEDDEPVNQNEFEMYPQDAELTSNLRRSIEALQVEEPKGSTAVPETMSEKIISAFKHFIEVWKLPGLVTYALCFACVKSAGYGILFWLPTYLDHSVGFTTEISWLLLSYEVGQLTGGISAGYMSDRLKSRALVLPFYLFGGVLVFIILTTLTKENYFAFAFFLYLAGTCIGGPYNYINAAISADLGANETVQGNKNAASAIPGIIDGTGSLLAALTNQFIPLFKGSVFWIFTGFCFVAGSLLTPLAYREYQKIKMERSFQKKALIRPILIPSVTVHFDN